MVKRLPPLTRVDKVLSKILGKNVILPRVEDVRVEDSVGRVAAETVLASLDVPPFNRSAVDGYAVHAKDTFGASMESPVRLKLIGRILSGEEPRLKVSPGECVYVATGASVPEGCDAVVMVEHTREEGDVVEVYKPASPHENISRRGEDFKAGEVLVKKGEIIKPWHVAALAASGIAKVKVYSRFRAKVYSTGDEIVEVSSEDIKPGKVYDSTRKLVIGYLKSLGFDVVDGGIIPDDIETIKREILDSVSSGVIDFLFLTGGSSVGERDYTVKALIDAGGELLVHGVAIKPGKPMAIGLLKNKLIFILSGFPVAAYVELESILKPLIENVLNIIRDPQPKVKGIITRRVNVEPGVRGYVRVRVYESDGRIYVEPLVLTGSGIISSMLRSNGILVVPEDIEGYDIGDEVEVILLGRVDKVG